MSPEQLKPTKGKDLTPASDVYALGLTAYELLTGRPANDGLSQGEIITKHLYEMPDPPSRRRPDLRVPASFDRVILKALAKNPGHRYQSALDFAAALEETYSRRTIMEEGSTEDLREQPQPFTPQPSQLPEQAEVRPLTPRPTPAQPPLPNRSQPSGQKEKRNYTAPALAAAAVLVVAGAFIFVPKLLGQRSDPPPQIQSTIQPETKPPASPPTNKPKPLKLLLTVQDVYEKPLANSSIAIFKPGITALPPRIDESNAIILRTDARGVAEVQSPNVAEGSYLIKIVRVGYQSLTKSVQFTEDKTRPGTAEVKIKLKAE